MAYSIQPRMLGKLQNVADLAEPDRVAGAERGMSVRDGSSSWLQELIEAHPGWLVCSLFMSMPDSPLCAIAP